jgi:Fe-S-cluster containining protein
MDKLSALLRPDDPLLRPIRLGTNQFPGVWGEMMPKELLLLTFPKEREATCLNCPKSCYEGFRSDYRCCTYHPRIANFLLGLGSETRAGDAALDRLLKLGMLTPEGMYSTPAQWIDFLDDQSHENFGRSEKVLCPMLNTENGFCDVHAFRNSVCSTFFCRSDHGRMGENFWMQVQTLGSQIELVLAQWALREVGFDLDAYIRVFDKLSQNIKSVSTASGWTDEALAMLWGNWRGREKDLMRESAALVVEHRDRLWTIANSHTIIESKLFDEAMDTLVPAHLESEVEGKDEDLETDGDVITLRPEETWQECLSAYESLWALPEKAYRLSPNVQFEVNRLGSLEEIYHKDSPFFIAYRFAAHEAPQWRLACSETEKSFLETFRQGRRLDRSIVEGAEAQRLDDPRTFVQEALNRRILWPVKDKEDGGGR